MEQHGDIPKYPSLRHNRWTAPSGRRRLGFSGGQSCREGTCSPNAIIE